MLPLSIAFFAPDGSYLDAFDMEPCTTSDCPRYDTPADHGPYLVSNINVHDNTIIDSGQTGIATDTGDGSIFSAGHRFEGNTYRGDVGWSWNGSNISWSSWRSYGHDGNGSYTP